VHRAASDSVQTGPAFAALSEGQLRRSVYLAVLSALLLPPFLGGSLMALLGFYPFPTFYQVFLSYSGIYVLLVGTLVLALVPRGLRRIVGLVQMPQDAAQRQAQKIFRRLPWYLMGLITLYSVFGALSADYSLQSLGHRQYELKDHLYNQFGLVPVVLITSFPIFFYFVDRLGRYLGPRGVHVTAIPLWVKLLMLGIVTPLLIDSLLIGYYYNRTGFFRLETLLLWLALLLLAAGGTWLAWRSLRQSIAPLSLFIAARTSGRRESRDARLEPLSLDELGVLTARFATLLGAQQELEQELRRVNEESRVSADAMRESERRFRDLAANVPGAIFRYLLRSDGSDEVEYMSPGCVAIWELAPEQIRQDPSLLWQMVDPADLPAMQDSVMESARSGQPWLHTWRITTPGGHRKWLQGRGQPERRGNDEVLWNSLILDITEQKLAEEALQRSEARLSEAQRIGRMGSWEYDVQTSAIVWSEEAYRIHEVDPAAFVPSYEGFLELVHPEDRARLDAAYRASLAEGRPYDLGYRVGLPDGRIKYLRFKGETEYHEGRAVRTVGMVQDVTWSWWRRATRRSGRAWRSRSSCRA